MQIIQKIRDKGAAIVIAVIALSLIGFILMDANLGISRNSAGSNIIGKVNGKPIDSKEFQDKIKSVEAQYGGRISGSQVYAVRQNAWDQLVFQKIAESEFDKLGLQFTPKELSSILFSDNAPQSLKQAFTGENGGYDINKAQQWWTSAKKFKGEQKEMIEEQVIEPTKMQSLYGKYSGLLSAGGYYPTWMKEKDATDAKTFANISYVAIPYNVVNDSTIKVSDVEINDYLSKHALQYKQDGGRQIVYATFSALPSSSDTLTIVNSLAALKASFATEADSTTNIFVSRNMSSKNFDDVYIPKSKLPAAQKDSIAALPHGVVYGPYLDGGEFVMAKVIGSKILPDSIKCRHILIGTTDRETGQQTLSDSIAKARIDSIEMAIKAGASFDELETKYSSDKAAHKDKGVMTFDVATIQNKNQFAKEFGEFLLNESGETKKAVKTNFGWHYIEILEKKNPSLAYKVAYLAKDIAPSDETVNMASAKASKLSGDARDIKAFEDYLNKNGIQKNEPPTVIKENDYNVGNLQDARQLVKWAFEAKEGNVSEPFNVGDQFVVGAVSKVVAAGLPDAKTARPQVEMYVRNNKKAEIIKSKITATPTLESAAAAYGVQVASAGADSSIIFSSSIINGIGNEPKVIGASFNKAYQTKTSEPIAGNNGVYVLKVNGLATKNPEAPEVAEKTASEKAKNMAQQMGYGWYEALKKLSDVVDERSKTN